MSYCLYPRLSAERASAQRGRLLSGDAAFDASLLEESLTDVSAFPPTGGRRITDEDLHRLREKCTAELGLPWPSGVRTDDELDLRIGRVLYEESVGSAGEFGNAQVWDFLTLILLPDLALERFPREGKGAIARLTGGNRRHVFQRLWRRWRVFGADIVQARELTEDDYVALLERRLTGQNRTLAVKTVREIQNSGRSGQSRREFTRVFMRQLVQVSGLVEMGDGEPDHLDALFMHVGEVTERALAGG
ncbi:hypothetical protein BJEO58_01004 [Brevibacterium jeotgali]|uniref:Uncharacterized protein n=2 Tax=Brevibacterium jeotgali TaxID=1262550 RepID=A0A2H1L3K2_9MICO|nr:hypothetical protein FB108_0326 [Brevibacterium jeotgali]SMY11419.1 hypothetical protein BJEO58_01004 [Brevibacterium jeotgali]